MAQTGSAQREPSMEEILASIRRIIQDSDAVQPPVDGEPPLAPPAPAADHLAEERGRHEVEAFRAELDQPLDEPFDPIDLHDDIHHADLHVEEPRAAPPSAAPQAELHSLREASAPVLDEVVLSPPLQDEDAQERPAAAPAVVEPAADARPAILSDHAGRQVAAAFGELSEAFAASRRRSFDDMAQEMLRPMLQEWLDNNLPTLVERLVREEIERVARGS